MWKKGEESDEKPQQRTETRPRSEGSGRTGSSSEQAIIGRSIAIKGDVTGDEDLVIQGRVDGSVDLEEHAITVGPDGEVNASIIGRVVTIEGRVEGDLTAEEQVTLRASAWVEGDISAPRVVLEDGARFLGGVDMGDRAQQGRKTGGRDAARKRTAVDSGKEESSGSGGTSGEKGSREKKDEDKSKADSTVKAGS